MTKTTIEWTQADDGTAGRVWNPVRGCTKVSPGCDHCYAETFAERWRGVPGHPYEQGFDLRLVPEKLDEPLRWKTPSRIFVNSMSDLFHADVPREYLVRVFLTMELAHWHTFLVLTKRADRLERVVSKFSGQFPLPNVWLGVSVESPAYYSRIRHLSRTPAAVRFLSCEPLLEPLPDLPLKGIGWVIVGGESGPGARPMQVEWAREIVGQCRRAGVPVFVKQLGSVWARSVRSAAHGDRKGGDPEQWPVDLRVREYPA